jgi:alkaline phosphatase
MNKMLPRGLKSAQLINILRISRPVIFVAGLKIALMTMRKFLFVTLLLSAGRLVAQPAKYTIANTHSHNDYEQSVPFWAAYDAGFTSIEADIFLRDGRLLVGHDTNEIKAGRTLEQYYLEPLILGLKQHHGHPYADTTRSLQMLIDLKTDSIYTLDTLVSLLQRYPLLTKNHQINWAITGNRPSPSRWTGYPSFISFDGVLSRDYDSAALSRVIMLSDDLKEYSQWNGKSNIPAADLGRLQEAVAKAHRLHKPVRFWDAPDFINAWTQLMKLGVDYINTDHISALADFLNHQGDR